MTEQLAEPTDPILDVPVTVDPAEAEKALLERTRKQEEEALNRSPEDVAAAMFMHYLPFLRNVLNNKKRMTRKSIVKVFLAAIEAPLNGDEFKLLKKDEREVYSVAMGCLEAKWQMMLTTLMRTQEKMAEEKAAKEAEAAATPNENVDVDSNANETDLKIQS